MIILQYFQQHFGNAVVNYTTISCGLSETILRHAFWSSFFAWLMLTSLCFNQILQQMRSDVALLTLEDGGPPVHNPSTAAEDARLASLISLDGISKQVKVLLPLHSIFSFSLVFLLWSWIMSTTK